MNDDFDLAEATYMLNNISDDIFKDIREETDQRIESLNELYEEHKDECLIQFKEFAESVARYTEENVEEFLPDDFFSTHDIEIKTSDVELVEQKPDIYVVFIYINETQKSGERVEIKYEVGLDLSYIQFNEDGEIVYKPNIDEETFKSEINFFESEAKKNVTIS